MADAAIAAYEAEEEPSEAEVEAAGRVVYAAGERHQWWPPGTPYEALDEISRDEFDGIIEDALRAARKARM